MCSIGICLAAELTVNVFYWYLFYVGKIWSLVVMSRGLLSSTWKIAKEIILLGLFRLCNLFDF